jgi:hypothetical protein
MAESRRQVALRLAAEARVDPRTAQRWLAGMDLRSAPTEQALTMAAARLKIRRERREAAA